MVTAGGCALGAVQAAPVAGSSLQQGSSHAVSKSLHGCPFHVDNDVVLPAQSSEQHMQLVLPATWRSCVPARQLP